MNTIKRILKFGLPLVILAVFFGCQDEDQEFGDVIAPTNLTLTFSVVGVDTDNPFGDGTGFVDFSASADNAITYRYEFGDDTDNQVAPNGTTRHRFNQQGVNTYQVTVIASGTGGVTTSTSVNVEVFSAFDDQEAKDFLTGGEGSSKVWYLAASEPGHLGVGPSLQLDIAINGGPSQFYFPSFFSAAPFEKCGIEISDCLCTDELTFTQNSDGLMTYQLNNNGQTFFNAGHQDIVGGSVGEDACFDFDTSGTNNVALAPSSIDWTIIPDPDFPTPRGTVINFTNNAFMGYYVSSSSYEIMEITDDYLYVRTIDGLNPDLAWYHKYSTSPPGEEDNGLVSEFNDLIWADEFNTDGTPDPANWTYDIGTGNNGWGNFESQYYTNDASNVVVSGGNLVITAKAESFMGSDYTSARIKSEDLVEFTYGRVEVRAKLPEGGGTWPALWMLGANFPEISWPDSGEIDIMEHRGNDLNTIVCNIFYPNGAGDAVNQGSNTLIEGVTSEFHNYTVEWRADEILFAVDNEVYATISTTGLPEFDLDFFLIMNVAMGGTFGGDIDATFTESSMEVDYVRVYQ